MLGEPFGAGDRTGVNLGLNFLFLAGGLANVTLTETYSLLATVIFGFVHPQGRFPKDFK